MCLRRFELLANALVRMLSDSEMARTRDAIQIDYLGDEGVVLLLTPETLEIRLPTVDWTQGTYGPCASTRRYQLIDVDDFIRGDGRPDEASLLAAVMRGVEARGAEFKPCRYCGECFPIEQRHGDACHGCAEREEGVIH